MTSYGLDTPYMTNVPPRLDNDGTILSDVELIRERWVRWFETLLKAKSPRLNANIAKDLDQRPQNMPRGLQPMMQELADDIHSLTNGKKALGPDGVSVELFKIALNGDPTLRRRLPRIAICIGGGGEVPQH